jgi:hypothetical protein
MLTPTPHLEMMHLPIPTIAPFPVDIVSFDWGSVAEWVTALAAVLALIGAIVSVALSAQANKITATAYKTDVLEREQAQARFVYALTDEVQLFSPGDTFNVGDGVLAGTVNGDAAVMVSPGLWQANRTTIAAKVTVYNRSQEMIGPLKVSLYEKKTGEPIGSMSMGASDAAPPLQPGGSVSYRLAMDCPNFVEARADLHFRDSSGRWWRRRDYDPIERSDEFKW